MIRGDGKRLRRGTNKAPSRSFAEVPIYKAVGIATRDSLPVGESSARDGRVRRTVRRYLCSGPCSPSKSKASRRSLGDCAGDRGGSSGAATVSSSFGVSSVVSSAFFSTKQDNTHAKDVNTNVALAPKTDKSKES